MESRKRVMLGSAVTAALLTGALVAGSAVAAPSVPASAQPETAATASDADTDAVEHEFEGEEIGENGNGIPDADEAAETK